MTAEVQRCVIENWHPTWNPNGTNNRSHWATLRRRHQVDAEMAWATARQAGWHFVEGRVQLTITFVYPRKYRVDPDNLTARCKGVIDGLKTQHFTGGFPRNIIDRGIKRKGFFSDDNTDALDLKVTSEVQPGRKGLVLVLEPVV